MYYISRDLLPASACKLVYGIIVLKLFSQKRRDPTMQLFEIDIITNGKADSKKFRIEFIWLIVLWYKMSLNLLQNCVFKYREYVCLMCLLRMIISETHFECNTSLPRPYIFVCLSIFFFNLFIAIYIVTYPEAFSGWSADTEPNNFKFKFRHNILMDWNINAVVAIYTILYLVRYPKTPLHISHLQALNLPPYTILHILRYPLFSKTNRCRPLIKRN